LWVAGVNQDSVINSKLTGLFNMNSTSFDVDLLERMIDLVVDWYYSVKPFFGGRGRRVHSHCRDEWCEGPSHIDCGRGSIDG